MFIIGRSTLVLHQLMVTERIEINGSPSDTSGHRDHPGLAEICAVELRGTQERKLNALSVRYVPSS